MSTPLQQAMIVGLNEAKRALKIEQAARDVVQVYAHRKHLGEADLLACIRVLEKALR